MLCYGNNRFKVFLVVMLKINENVVIRMVRLVVSNFTSTHLLGPLKSG